MHEIIDVNCDCGAYAFREYPQETANEVLGELGRIGVQQAIVGSARAITFVSPQPANELLAEELRAVSDESAGPRPTFLAAATLNPAYPGVERDLQRCAELGFGALKLYPTYHDFDLTSYETVRLVDQATTLGWPVLVVARVEDERHHHPLMRVPPLSMEKMITFARNVPAAAIILCTATAPEVTSFLQGVNRPNACADVAHIKGPLNAMEELVEKVGHERLLFGSHAPFSYARTVVAKVVEAYITDEQKVAILRRNAERLLDAG